MSDRQLIAGAAQRLAGFGEAIVDAHLVHGIEPGKLDDLTSVEFHHTAVPIYELTLSDEYLRSIGVSFGGISALMGLFADAAAGLELNPAWTMVQRYYRGAAETLAPDWAGQVIDQPTLLRAAAHTPSVMRFDLLAEQVTTSAATGLVAASREVVTLVSVATPHLIDLRVEDLPGRLRTD